MLQKEFFQVQPFNPKVIPLTLVFQKSTPGNYTFTVPDQYNYVQIEFAGAAGQQAYVKPTQGTASWNGTVGKGAIKTIFRILTNKNISGVLGAQPAKIFNQSHFGGTGYQSGANGGLGPSGEAFAVSGGGGGGSSSVTCNNILTTAGGGSGCGVGMSGWFNVNGGAGGNPNGGATASGTPSSSGTTYNGHNATDAGVTNFNDGNGYIKIWGGYNPYYD